jgi:rhamnogalacturonan endolyase
MRTHHATAALFLLLTANGALAADPPVIVTQDNSTFTLSNGILIAKVSKTNGDLTSMIYNGIETMYVPGAGTGGGGGGHPWGYWEQTPGRNSRNVDSLTIDPANNNGDRAEVSVKGFYDGSQLGQGAPGGGATCDIDLRYTLGRGEHGIYSTAIYTHEPSTPAGGIGESRWGAKLNPAVFDWLSVDSRRNKMMLSSYDWAHGTQLNGKEMFLLNTGIYKGQVEHKYDYSACLFDTPAFGWSSTTKHIGWWCINPSSEYIGGGATKVELTCHRDLNAVAAPTVLDYWRGTHYGGTTVNFAQGESWTKVVGPIFNYCNTGDTPEAIFQDALAQAKKEQAAWPYPWVNHADYPTKSERATVTGRLHLDDPQGSGKMSHLLVGLTHPDYTLQGGGGRGNTGPRTIDWQQDAKYYQFWTRATDEGAFSIPNVRPGAYTLHAIASGVLGEFAATDIIVQSGQPLDLGTLDWKPVRYGKQLWDIGIPDRSAAEFLHGDHYWQWGLYLQYANDFPNDVHFLIGKSDFHKDWNYAQVPHGDGKDFRTPGKPTSWSITYDVPAALKGTAILRLALAGASHISLAVALNGKSLGSIGPLTYTATINRDGIAAQWVEKDLRFDASLMNPGTNTLKLTIPGGSLFNGIEYDYLRLELNEKEAPPR